MTWSEGFAPAHTPSPWAQPGLPPPDVAWNGAHLIDITAWGSSGCPNLPTVVRITGRNELTITMHVENLSHSDSCASDLVADTSTIKVPPGIDSTIPTTVQIDGTTISLAPMV